MDALEKHMLEEVADLHEIPEGAFNIRYNGKADGRRSTTNIEIVPKKEEGKSGIDILIKPGTKNQSVHIPVVLSLSGLKETVYNDFYVGEDSDVTIVAGCGISNCGAGDSQHDGIHTFHIGKNAKVRYIEKHYGEGTGTGDRILNPVTIIEIEEGGSMEMDSVQIKGVTSTKRETRAVLGPNTSLEVKEKIMTHGTQYASTDFTVDMNGDGSSANIISRSVAKENSRQYFRSRINGNCRCSGHSECDSIIMDHGSVTAEPQLTANDLDASLIHEAAIGKIAGDQLIKLMTLGLTEAEAEEQIVNGFLK